MSLEDLVHGRRSTIQVELEGAAPPTDHMKAPARIFQPAEALDPLLAVGSEAWAVHGLTVVDTGELEKVLERGRPLVAWIVSAIPNVDGAFVLQVHEFA